MDPKLVDFVLQKASHFFTFSDSVEITLEANPSSSDVKNFKSFKESGVNRLSIGVQSLRNHHLSFLGRQHSVDEALRIVDIASSLFPRFSFDLIYALPNQTLQEWKEDLEKVFTFDIKHLSLYQLMIEEGTAFATRFARGDFSIPDQDLAADFYHLTHDFLSAKGLYGYEISNYAVPGFESLHNLTYWYYQDYIGIGPGSHSRVTLHDQKHSFYYPKNIEKWLANHDIKQETLTEEDIFKERFMMNLRLKEGIPFHLIEDKIDLKKIDILRKENIVILENGYLSLVRPQLHQGVLKYLLP